MKRINQPDTEELKKLKSRLKKIESEYTNKENLLIQLEKLSTIGQYIGEITHELKNPLSAISGYAELARLVPTVEEKMKYLEKIPSNISKISKRLSQFRSMIFNTGTEYGIFDLNENLAQCLSTLEILKPKGTHINCSLSKNKLPVLGDSEQWFQVFLSLVKLYFKQMNENNSELSIETRSISSEQIQMAHKEKIVQCRNKRDWLKSLSETADWVKIKFENDKLKINKKSLKNAFSGNIHSKNGTLKSQLGIVIASDIVKRHGGNIIASFPGSEGLCLEVFSPSVHK